MTQPLTPTQADIIAASELICDQSLCDCEICMAKFSQAFAAHAQAARLEGARAIPDVITEGLTHELISRGLGGLTASQCNDFLAALKASLDPLSIAEKGV